MGKGGDHSWFVFCVLPFGLSTARYIFIIVTRVLLRHWRKDNIRCQLSMDEGSGEHSTVEGALAIVKIIQKIEIRSDSGLVCSINEQKCHREVNMREGIIRVTKGRVEKLKSFVKGMSQV